MEAWTIVLICCWVLRTIMIPRTREKKFLHCGVWKGSYTVEAWTIVLICCWGIEHHNRFLHHGSMEKFLHCGSVERFLHHGSIEDCSDLLLGIKHHNDS